MNRVLILTEPRSVELAKQVVRSIDNFKTIIGKIVTLVPSATAPETTFNTQLSSRVQIGEALPSIPIRHIWPIYDLHYKIGMESFILPQLIKENEFDLVVTVDSGRAEAALLAKDPNSVYKTVVLRGVPKSLAGFDLRYTSPISKVTMDQLYDATTGRVDLVIVPTNSERAALNNKLTNVITPCPIETADFPILHHKPANKAAIRSNIHLPKQAGSPTLMPQDKVILSILPTMDEIGVTQPDVLSLLEVIYGVSESFGERTAPKWLIMLGAASYREMLRGAYLPEKMRANIVLLGKQESENTFFDEHAMITFLSAADLVVDFNRDGCHNMLTATAAAWGMPVISAGPDSTVNVATIGSNLFGYRPKVDDAISNILRHLDGRATTRIKLVKSGVVGQMVNEIIGV